MKGISPIVAAMILMMVSLLLAAVTVYQYSRLITAMKGAGEIEAIQDKYGYGDVVDRYEGPDGTIYWVIKENFTVALKTTDIKASTITYTIDGKDASFSLIIPTMTTVNASFPICEVSSATLTSQHKEGTCYGLVKIIYVATVYKTGSETYLVQGNITAIVPVYSPDHGGIAPIITSLIFNGEVIYSFHYTIMKAT